MSVLTPEIVLKKLRSQYFSIQIVKLIKIKVNLCRKLVGVKTRHSGDSKSGRNQRGDHPLEPLKDLFKIDLEENKFPIAKFP